MNIQPRPNDVGHSIPSTYELQECEQRQTHLSLIGVCFNFFQPIVSVGVMPSGSGRLYLSIKSFNSSGPVVKDLNMIKNAWKKDVSVDPCGVSLATKAGKVPARTAPLSSNMISEAG